MWNINILLIIRDGQRENWVLSFGLKIAIFSGGKRTTSQLLLTKNDDK